MDFLLTGKINSKSISDQIVKSVSAANDRLKSLDIKFSKGAATTAIRSLNRQLQNLSKPVKISLDTDTAKTKLAELVTLMSSLRGQSKLSSPQISIPKGGGGISGRWCQWSFGKIS